LLSVQIVVDVNASGEFRFLASGLLDRIMPMPVVASCVGAVWLSRSPLATSAFGAAYVGANLALNVMLARAPGSTWAPRMVGVGRLLLTCVLVPLLILSAGEGANVWFVALPGAAVVPFLFQAGRAWAPAALVLVVTLATSAYRDYSLEHLAIAALTLGSTVFISARLVEALQGVVQRALLAERTQGEFLATMSHEIRTPMNGVLGALRLLQSEGLQERQRELVEVAESSASGLLVILNDILDLSKLEAGKFTVDPGPFDPSAFLRCLEKEFRTRSAAEATAFHAELRGEPPAAVLADETRVRQILRNFLSNAFKFGKGTHVTLTLTCSAAADSPDVRLRFEVADGGPGIPPQALPRLFQRFEQADSGTSRGYGGTGLGLAISRRLAQLMGGHVGVESELGKGARFWLELSVPRCKPAAPSSNSQPNHELGIRVLAVDDNPFNRLVVRRMLEKIGCTVTLAESGREALELLVEPKFDAVLMDCQMPEMDGYETTRRIKALPGRDQLPVVALTASATVEDRERCKDAGMDDFLTKPIELESMARLLGQLVSHRRPARHRDQHSPS
jgi:signal transduction histidine kinase/ActR/RegA family two-component response regulator